MAKIDMGIVKEVFTLRPPYRAHEDWPRLVKSTVARFARGNISAQTGHVLMPDDQAEQRANTLLVAEKWKRRAARRNAASAREGAAQVRSKDE